LYRIQENVRKVVPLAVEIRKNDEATMKGKLQGCCFDLEYSLEAVQSIKAADASFANTQDMLKNAIFLKQQLKCEESKRRRENPNRDSVYKRFSAHIPIEYVVRETTTRVENIIGMNTTADAQAIQRSHTTL
jgi:BLOC-1 related complex subunit 8